jgi:replication factor C subunit 3/5
MEEGTDKAIVSLSGGDMRKVLNILESCSLAYKTIPLKKIYDVTGRPSPDDIGVMFKSLTEQNFNTACNTILDMKALKSLSLDDIIRDVH